MKFKIGDLVIRNNKDLTHFPENLRNGYHKVAEINEDWIKLDCNNYNWWFEGNFDLVKTDSKPTLEDEIEIASKLVGKTFKYCNILAKITGFTIHHKSQLNTNTISYAVATNLKQNDFCVALTFVNGSAPMSDFDLKINDTVELNSEYNAQVGEKIVTVGCQKIPIEKVKEILNLHKELYD